MSSLRSKSKWSILCLVLALLIVLAFAAAAPFPAWASGPCLEAPIWDGVEDLLVGPGHGGGVSNS